MRAMIVPRAQAAVRSLGLRARRDLVVRIVPVGIVVGLIACVLGVWLASGARLFVVETASMGRAAPVGTLVVDLPVSIHDIAVGDVITYAPKEAAGITITHRVVAVGDGVVRTRGDLNATRDPWRITAPEVIGRAALLIPGAGWLIRAVPLLLLGAAVVIAATSFLASATARAGARVLGASAVVAMVLTVLRPLTNYQVVATRAIAGGVQADVVSTGLLPLRLVSGPRVLELTSGEAGRLLMLSDAHGRYTMTSFLDLDVLGWALLGLFALLPTLWVLLVGLPSDPVRPAGAA